ncbi:MAG: acetyl-CoA C-acetyltransferase, partial [Candidatus Binatota bacterium]|nr:acetyl-CoA C-acetyltransferase [Candidatus Binatota bacterium]
RLLERIDSIAVNAVLFWRYGNAPRLLAERIGARPVDERTTTIGGNSPQLLVNDTAERIAAGRVRLALLAGAEAAATLARARKKAVTVPWSAGGGDGAPEVLGDARPGTNDHEVAHGLVMPIHVYPLFENAIRARHGWSIAAHRRRLGDLMSRFSRVAADNPYAWFRTARSAEEIATESPANRMIGFPYMKYMNAIMDVDQSAAVLMTSVGAARELGIHPSRWVYLRGSADAHDHWWVSDRVNYWSSPALELAGERALAQAGIDIGDVGLFDLYSCFPSAVQIARDALGIDDDDPRPLTVTGGLPYHGGPANDYAMHSIATMMDRLRRSPRTIGVVTALGWYVTKHSVGVYATEPASDVWSRADPAIGQVRLDAGAHPELVREPAGRGTVETYTVLHDREGAPNRGIVYGRLPDGRRFLANTPEDRRLLESMTIDEAIGRTGEVTSADGRNRFDPD